MRTPLGNAGQKRGQDYGLGTRALFQGKAYVLMRVFLPRVFPNQSTFSIIWAGTGIQCAQDAPGANRMTCGSSPFLAIPVSTIGNVEDASAWANSSPVKDMATLLGNPRGGCRAEAQPRADERCSTVAERSARRTGYGQIASSN